MAQSEQAHVGGYSAFAYGDFTLYQIARFFIVAALEMQSVAVGWQVYDITRKPLDLGLVGLAQFLPSFLLFLVAGHAVDRFERRKILLLCYAGLATCSGLLLVITYSHYRTVYSIYVVMVLVGIVRSFSAPGGRAFLPEIVPEEHFPNAIAWNATFFEASMILGPAVGGFLYGITKGPHVVYGAALLIGILATLSMLRIKSKAKPRPRGEMSMKTVLAGLGYIWEQKLILGSISLDLFAVLLGGAVALLPVFAREILHTGPWGLGLLRSAPGVGAAIMALAVAHRPFKRRVGLTMLWCVAGFGVCTIIFGLSRSLIVSLIALLLLGAADMVSVIIRGILVQLGTPDSMRGRVNAVEMLFIGASNELGQFESGVTAAWFGAIPAVILGGIGTLVVVACWAWMFPELRNADQFVSVRDEALP
jgi:MFS family permease